MNTQHIATIATELGLRETHVTGAADLFAEGAEVPFIARYRKERTGEIDEDALRRVRDRLSELAALDARRAAILESLRERELLTDELTAKLDAASSRTELEDIYLPYRPKRKSRASKAREQGLEPLAERVFRAEGVDPMREAQTYVDPTGGLPDAKSALAGARDIIAEWIAEDTPLRRELRELFASEARITAKRAPKRAQVKRAGAIRESAGRQEPGETYRDYFDWSEAAHKAPSHRVLAMFRGEREGVLTVHVLPAQERALRLIEARHVQKRRLSEKQNAELQNACSDAYKRLIAPSLETEAKAHLKERADETAAAVFAGNLRELLLAAPLGQRSVLAVDPGFRTGCKVVCLNPQGVLLHHETIYPLEPHNREPDSARRVQALLANFAIDVIAVGNGTGGREAAAFLRRAVAEESAGSRVRRGAQHEGSDTAPAAGKGGSPVTVISVNEAGASVYSASPIAREEFPDHDVTVRGAVSIGRRLMDPLAELVKIDPKSIGVGQYQHDVDQKLLDARLTDTVVSCVNAVGVELNTASACLLQYVSGITPKVAKAIVEHRTMRGPFSSRAELRNVRGLGEKTFEQCAGFLRVQAAHAPRGESGGAHPLDASGVHPERYGLVERMARDLRVEVPDLIGSRDLCDGIELERYVDGDTGLATLRDIHEELLRPGRDPRPAFEEFFFDETVHDIFDLRPGMRLPGVVTNVTNFGAFVDLGVHRDGLIHISKLAERYVTDPHEIVRVNQTVTVYVTDVDLDRSRIGLSLID
ncbi:MAG: Tex family protein [Spirochaetaceae bacterium]